MHSSVESSIKPNKILYKDTKLPSDFQAVAKLLQRVSIHTTKIFINTFYTKLYKSIHPI